MAYPSDWHTAELPGARACTFFDPKPLQVPENSDVYGFALEVSSAQESFDAVVQSLTAPRFFENATREELEVAGHRAVRVEATSTGAGLYDKGLVTRVYVVDRGDRPPLVLQTFKTPGSDWPGRKRVLDASARTLVVFTPPEAEQARAQPPLPRPVERKRAALLAAATDHDYDRLEALSDRDEFQFTYGSGAEGPAAYWQQLERTRRAPSWAADPDPAEALAALLTMPHTVVESPSPSLRRTRIYVWPFAYDKEPGALTREDEDVLAPIATRREIEQMARFGSYIDWRTGITPDGRWIFFISGD